MLHAPEAGRGPPSKTSTPTPWLVRVAPGPNAGEVARRYRSDGTAPQTHDRSAVSRVVCALRRSPGPTPEILPDVGGVRSGSLDAAAAGQVGEAVARLVEEVIAPPKRGGRDIRGIEEQDGPARRSRRPAVQDGVVIEIGGDGILRAARPRRA